jgi:hypothetical protein
VKGQKPSEKIQFLVPSKLSSCNFNFNELIMANREAIKEQNIRQYYTEVNKFVQAGEYEKVIKSANKSEKNDFLNLTFSSSYLNFFGR